MILKKERAKRRHLKLLVQIHCLFLQLGARHAIFLTWYLHSQPPRGRNATNAAERSGSSEVNPVQYFLIPTAGLNPTGCVSSTFAPDPNQALCSNACFSIQPQISLTFHGFCFVLGFCFLVVAVAIKARKNESLEGRVTKKKLTNSNKRKSFPRQKQHGEALQVSGFPFADSVLDPTGAVQTTDNLCLFFFTLLWPKVTWTSAADLLTSVRS